MRVLMLSDYYPPHVGGGVERVASELCQGLSRRGHTVTMLTLKTRPSPGTEGQGSLTIERAKAMDLTGRLGVQFALSAHLLPAAIRLLRSLKPDLVHVHNLFFRTTEVASLLRMVTRVPLVTTLHLGRLEGQGGTLKLLTSLYEATMGRYIVRRSDHVIAVSEAVADQARRLGKERDAVTVVPNGVDADLFHPRPASSGCGKGVLFVGRLVPNKGPETLVRAAPMVIKRRPDTTFTIVGDGPLREPLQRLARNLGVERAVSFLGVRHDVPDLMRDAALMVRPSTLEGMPLTVLEAMATALPVVATPVGGTPEIVKHGQNGYLVPVGDCEALAKSTISLLEDAPLAQRMGRRGREMVEASHTWERVVEQTEEVYSQVTSR